MKRDDDTRILEASREAFVAAAPHALGRLEEALLVIDGSPFARGRLDVALEAAREIEIAASACRCMAPAALARDMQQLLELLRNGRLQVTEEATSMLLAGRDQIEAEIEDLRAGRTGTLTRAHSEQLQQVLRALGGSESGSEQDNTSAADRPPALTGAAGQPGVPATTPSSDGAWHLSLRFTRDGLRLGVDPLAVLRCLRAVGEIGPIETIVDDVPPLADLDAEASYLGVELRLRCDGPRRAIDEALAPMSPHPSIEILAPGARPAEFDALLQRRCGDDEAARSRLVWIWLALGVNIRLRDELPVPAEGAGDEAAVPAAPVALSAPKIERRAEPARDRRVKQRDRRSAADAPFVSVRADKLEHLAELLGELATASSAAQAAARHESSAAVQMATQRVAQLAQGACEGTLALQRVPVGRSLEILHTMTEAGAQAHGKLADLTVTGGEADVDATMADVLADALSQVLRNSLEHGIETPAERVANGKPERGQLKLDVRESAGSVIAEWSDDGRGLDRESLLRRATAAALVPAGAQLDEAEIWQLAFAPQLPRASAADARRRHAAGLDAVRRNIESLRGRITVSSADGIGTTTQIRLPLSMSMIDGVLALVGDTYYVIPLAAVDEIIEAPAEGPPDAASPPRTIELRGQTLPCLDLARFCGCEARDGQTRRRSVLIVHDGRARVGLLVDRVLGRQHAALKPLAGFLGHLRTLAGSMVLGSGDVGLVLDVPGLVAAASALGERAPVH